MNEDQAANKETRRRVYWRDIIEKEEQNRREREQQDKEQLEEDQQIVENKPMTEQEMERIKGLNDGEPWDKNDKSIKQIGTVDPVNDFKQMVEDRKVDRVQ